MTEIEGQYEIVEGLKTHYIRAGSGSPLLILHGSAPEGPLALFTDRASNPSLRVALLSMRQMGLALA